MALNGNGYGNSKDNQNILDIMRLSSANNIPTQSAENLIPVHTRASIFRRRSFFKKLSLGLSIALLILLIAFLTILCMWVHNWSELSSLRNICTSKECIRTAASFRTSMDMSVDPCEDFYQYSCGHWSDEHPNHGWYPKFSNFEFIEERVDIAARGFLKQNNSASDPLPVKQSRLFYQSCMDVDEMNRRGVTVMYEYLKKAKLPMVPSFFANPGSSIDFDWKKVDANLKKVFDMDLFVGFTVDANIFNRSTNVIFMGVPSAGSPLPSPFKTKRITKEPFRTTVAKDNATSELQEKMYKKVVYYIIKTVLANVTTNVPPDDVIHNATNLLWNMTNHLEELANINETAEEDVTKITAKELQLQTDKFFQENSIQTKEIWVPYLQNMFYGVPNVTLDLENRDFIYTSDEDVEYLHKLALTLSKTSNVSLELLAWWSAIQVMVGNTGHDISDYIYKEMSTTRSYSVARLRSLDCSELVIKFMGIAVSYGIAEKTFLNETIPKVEEMLQHIKDAFVEQVRRIHWMDEKTKKVTLEKNEEMMSFIGFPEWLLNKEDVETYYKNITIRNNTYLDNMMEFVGLFFPYRLASLREENEKTWIVDPTTVNAFNYFSENSIYVPMAILTFPMYNLGLEVLNYGAIGSILGHELTHGFDNSGRLYDQLGNYRQWWSNDTIQTFVNKTECFVNQYDAFKIEAVDMNIQGKNTLGENIADNGGLNHAFVAYQKYVKQNGEDQKLPGFRNFTNDQMFFVAFGSIWCEERNPALLKDQILNDAHCPSSIRVLGTLQNSENFAQAFNCPKGSKMNPDREKCRLW